MQKIVDLKIGMRVERITFSIKSLEAYKAIQTFFQSVLETPGTFGRGLMAFAGSYSSDNTIFLGINTKLESRVLSFINDENQVSLQSFRDDFLNLTENEGIKKQLSISSVNAIYVTEAPETVNISSDLIELFETSIKMQQKSVPKFVIDKGALYIGGKTGATSLKIQGSVASDLNVKFIVLNLKLKDNAADNFYRYLSESILVDCSTVIAFVILNQLGRTTLSPLLTEIQTKLIKDFPVGKVVNFAETKQKSTTKSGKYVIRSLNGITNKLKDAKTCSETQLLFENWFVELETKHRNEIKSFNEFYQKLRKSEGPVNL